MPDNYAQPITAVYGPSFTASEDGGETFSMRVGQCDVAKITEMVTPDVTWYCGFDSSGNILEKHNSAFTSSVSYRD